MVNVLKRGGVHFYGGLWRWLFGSDFLMFKASPRALHALAKAIKVPWRSSVECAVSPLPSEAPQWVCY